MPDSVNSGVELALCDSHRLVAVAYTTNPLDLFSRCRGNRLRTVTRGPGLIKADNHY